MYPSMHWHGGCLPGEVSAQAGVCQGWGVFLGGVYLGVSAGGGLQTPPPENGMTDRQL